MDTGLAPWETQIPKGDALLWKRGNPVLKAKRA